MWTRRCSRLVRRGVAPGVLTRFGAALLVFGVLMAPPSAVQALPHAQDSGEENTERAVVGLSGSLFTDKTTPPGYSLSTSVAYTNDAEAFDAVMQPPPDPRPMEDLFNHLDQAGRVLRLRQDMESDDDDSAPELRYAVILFDDAEHAAAGLKDPSVLDWVVPDAQVGSLSAPSLGDGSVGYTIDETRDPDVGPERALLIAWRRGRVVYTASAITAPDAADAAQPAVLDLANRADKIADADFRTPDRFKPPTPEYMPSPEMRLALYQGAANALPADDAFGDEFTATGVNSVPNALLILDDRRNVRAWNDMLAEQRQLQDVEHHILGVSKEFDQANADPDSPISQYPSVSVGYHLYADNDGGHQAVDQARPEEISLRMNEEITLLNNPAMQQVTNSSPAREALPFEMRYLDGHTALKDGSQLDLLTVRWHMAGVELFVDVAVPAGTDTSKLVNKGIRELGMAYKAQPIDRWAPGFTPTP